MTQRTLRLAYFSPLTPQRSGISDYSEELLPHLAAGAEIDLFTDGFTPANAALRERFRFYDYRAEPERLARLGEYDAAVYHMGNDHRYHAGIYAAARAIPGVVVLHDYALQHFFLGLARARSDLNIYLDELGACHGGRARAEAERALRRGAEPSCFAQPLAFPLNCRLARDAEGVIVHSRWSRARLAEVAPATPVAVVNHHVVAEPREEDDARRSPAVDDAGARRAVEIASFGHITSEKGLERVLAALAALKSDHAFRFTLVGVPDHFDVRELVRAHGLTDRVEVTGYVALAEFKARLAACDIAINLRERTVGETSGSVCRAMAAGVPVVVSNVGWFAELPDDCAIKIDAGEAGDAQLRAYLARLIADASLRRRMGDNARRHALDAHGIERSAAGYLDFIRRVVAGRARRRFVGGIATELAACGVREDDDEILCAVAMEVARLAPALVADAEPGEV